MPTVTGLRFVALVAHFQEEGTACRQHPGRHFEGDPELVLFIVHADPFTGEGTRMGHHLAATPVGAGVVQVAAFLDEDLHALGVEGGLLVVAPQLSTVLFGAAPEGPHVLGAVHALVVQDVPVVLPQLEEVQADAQGDEHPGSAPPMAAGTLQQQGHGNGQHRVVVHEDAAAEPAAVVPDPPTADDVGVGRPVEQEPGRPLSVPAPQQHGARGGEQQHRCPQEEPAPESEEDLDHLGPLPHEAFAAVSVGHPMPGLQVPHQGLDARDQRSGQQCHDHHCTLLPPALQQG